MAADMAATNRSMIEHQTLRLDYSLIRLQLPSLFLCSWVFEPMWKLIKFNSDFAPFQYAQLEPQLLIHRKSFNFSNFHLVDLDINTSSRFEINPSFNLPLPDFDVAQSSNGLLLLEHTDMVTDVQKYIVFSPMTGEYVRLPETNYPCRNVRCSFYYTPETNQFKVFRIFHRLIESDATCDSFMELDPPSDFALNPCSAMVVDPVSDRDSRLDSDSDSTYYDSDSDSTSDSDSVYSESDVMGEILVGGSDSWESLGILPCSPRSIYYPCHLGKTTHWLCSDENVPSLIVFFNFETHQVGEIPGPAHMNKTHADAYDAVTLVVLGKCLSIFDGFTSETKIDVWKMKKYGDQASWSLDYVIDTTVWNDYGFDHYFRPIICRNNGVVVMVSADGYMIFYDLSKATGRVVYHPPLEHSWNELIYTPSYISLREVARGSNLEVLDVASRFVDPELNVLNYLELMGTFPEKQTASYL